MERQIEGSQSCKDRLYKKDESKMQQTIDKLLRQIETEEMVSETIKKHLGTKQLELIHLAKEREAKMHKEAEVLEAEKARIQELRQQAQDDYDLIKSQIGQDDEYR